MAFLPVLPYFVHGPCQAIMPTSLGRKGCIYNTECCIYNTSAYATIAAKIMRDRGRGRGDLPDISKCACTTLRRAARLVTQLYDEELRRHLPASQFALLSAIERRPGCNQSML